MTDQPAFVVGIDLGTTNSCVAELSATGAPNVISHNDGTLIPSVVYFESADRIIVGKTAKNLAAAKPELVCAAVKREMSKEPSKVEPLTYHGKDYTPEAISALILTKVVNDARETNGLAPDTPVKAVITVPAYFGTIGKNATEQAGKLAAIDVIYTAPEPVAAAFAYGEARVTELQTVLVYDLGGGTFDVTVVQIDGRSAHVVSFDGERTLGGLDWDQAIVDWVRQSMLDDHGIDLPTGDAVLDAQLRERAEQAKHALSSAKVDSTDLAVDYQGTPYTFRLTRERFEEITNAKLEVTLEKTKKVLEAAESKGVTEIDHVILVGGSSRMLAVAEGVKRVTGLTPQLFRPDTAVAEGAALLAGMVADGAFDVDMDGTADPTTLSARPVTMLTSKSLGLEVYDKPRDRDVVSYIVPKDTPQPARGSKTFGTLHDNQTDLTVRIFEERSEESEAPEENTLLHETSIKLPAALPENAPIEFEFRVDDAGVLHVFVTEPTSGENWEIKVDQLNRASDDDVARLRPARQAVA